jgi:hypothetical protein
MCYKKPQSQKKFGDISRMREDKNCPVRLVQRMSATLIKDVIPVRIEVLWVVRNGQS